MEDKMSINKSIHFFLIYWWKLKPNPPLNHLNPEKIDAHWDKLKERNKTPNYRVWLDYFQMVPKFKKKIKSRLRSYIDLNTKGNIVPIWIK